MAAERSSFPSSLPKEHTLDWSMSRRDFTRNATRFLSSAVVVGALGTGWRYKDEAREMLEGGGSREEFDRYIKEQGFSKIEENRRKELMGDSTSFTTIATQESPSPEPEGLIDVSFTLAEPTFVAITVEGDYDEIGSLPVVTATTTFDELNYVVPILQTRFEKAQTFALKTVPPGYHSLHFQKTNASDSLGEKGITVSIKTPDALTPFGQAVLDCLPILGMETDFALHNIFNDDAPFFRNGNLYERTSDGKIRVAFFEGRSSENGGIGNDPVEMDQKLHRLFDFDHSVITTLGREDAKVYELAHQEDRVRSHRIVTDVIFPNGIDPKSVQDRFFYHSVPDHGMVKKGLERGGDGELIHPNVYALFPQFTFPLGSEIEIERMRVRKLVAVREQQREHNREMQQLSEIYQSLFTPENFPKEFEISEFLDEQVEELIQQ